MIGLANRPKALTCLCLDLVAEHRRVADLAGAYNLFGYAMPYEGERVSQKLDRIYLAALGELIVLYYELEAAKVQQAMYRSVYQGLVKSRLRCFQRRVAA